MVNEKINQWLRQTAGHAPQPQPLQQPQPPKIVANAGAGMASEVPPNKPSINDWLRAEAFGIDIRRFIK